MWGRYNKPTGGVRLKQTSLFVLLVFALGPIAAAQDTNGLRTGMSRAEVIAVEGQPTGSFLRQDGEILLFEKGSVTLRNGKVTAIELMTPEQYEKQKKLREEARLRQEAATHLALPLPGVLGQVGGKVRSNPSPKAMDMDKGFSLASFANHPLFAKDGPSKDDVFQGGGGDCYFLSALAALAEANPGFIRNTVMDLSDGTYVVRFFRQNGEKTYVRVTAELWVDNSGAPTYARLGRQGCIWAPIIEKAFAICRRRKASYGSIVGGNGREDNDLIWKLTYIKIDEAGVNPDDVISWLNSGAPEGHMKDTIRARAQTFLGQVNAQRQLGKGMVLGAPPGFSNKTPLVPSSAGFEKSTYRRGKHVYTVDHVKVDAKGDFTGIVLRNPGGRYVTITDYARIFFCIISAATVEPQAD